MKKIIILLSSILITCSLFLNVSANNVKIIDEANILSNEQKEKLTSLIDEYIDHSAYDMVIYLANKRSDYFEKDYLAITKLADDTFDYQDYGLGKDKDGIILCADLYYHEYAITTHGKACIDTYSNAALESIYKKVTPLFVENKFYDGILAFIDGATFAKDNYYKFHDNKYTKAVVPSLVGSSIVTLISFIVFRSRLQSRKENKKANQYIKNPKFNLLNNREIYLYSSMTRTKKARNNDNNTNRSSSSSPTHISSSGQVHGGGSRKF